MIGLLVAAVGLVLLVAAADRLVADASLLSSRLGVPEVVIGAVLIGVGTSLPELLVSALAALEGEREIAVANIVGSNLANLTLVVGIVGLLARPVISSRLLTREVPIATAAVVALAVLLPLTRADGLVLVSLLVVSTVVILRGGSAPDDELARELRAELDQRPSVPLARLALTSVAALVVIAAGAQLLVMGSVRVADDLGLADGLVGFTLVALGTTAPEIVTAVHAARRGAPDLAIGNVLGSNLFNSLGIGAVVALASPGAVATGLSSAAWVTVGASVLVWILMWSHRRIVRWEAILMMAVYAGTIPLVA